MRKKRAKLTTQKSIELIKEAIKLQLQLESIKPLYHKMDQLTEALVNSNLTEGSMGYYRIFIIDNFRHKNTAWKSSPFKRYEVKIEKRLTKTSPFTPKKRNI